MCVWGGGVGGGYLHSQQHPLPTFVCGRKGAAMSQKREVTHVLSFQTSQQLFFFNFFSDSKVYYHGTWITRKEI